mmetsp:Transcript_24355/g.45053  ORF Transcript_24355/g.45053 Transcript_24355/m.45053 type:complete len:461 (-) Transcript_24355:34-1416(-)|eukprot:CAMPEP_0197439692 /NCGR_PEP_ID=MMETSP1175-20131217/6373_1 /TAXON_ID=1003142 /ORGANISM="Triceratium dubium, Strain CCMP147" /LENGTH=460 /DNA_ID=CAMNT_0042969645 /DNA_START=98 /DNA_END=1480 /DNA_ORIENTATION=-
MSSAKTPTAVSDAIKKLDAKDQVAVQTYIAKLKGTIEELEGEILKAKDGDAHAHYHGHEKCTSDHSHSGDGHHGEEEVDHEHGHDHGGHSHEHEHAHHHSSEDDIPAWKKKAMESGANDPTAAPFGGSWNTEASVDATATAVDDEMEDEGEPPFPPMYETGDDFDKASNLKMEASDLKGAGDYAGAVEKYSAAIVAAEPSPLLYANRADCLLRLNRPRAAVRDCDAALALNPDSAKALRIRGRARKALGEYEGSLKDLSASQTIDYDDAAALDLKFVTEKHVEMEKEQAKKRVEDEEKLRKRAEEIKKAQEEAKSEAERERRQRESERSSTGGMPGGMPGAGAMPAGMAGMMGAMMSDPEIAAGLQNPKVMQAFSELMSGPGGAAGLMSNPAKLQEMMSDPEVGPFMQKLMTKLGPMMGGGAAGMPGMSGFGGAGSAGPSARADAGDDDMPDLDDLPDLD